MGWSLDDSRPIWPQLKEELMRQIVSKKYQSGGAFPTVRDLAAEAGVNRNTMQRAMAELEAEGLLITNRTAGRTVTTDDKLIEEIKERLAYRNIEDFLSEMAAIGYGTEEVAAMIQEKVAAMPEETSMPKETAMQKETAMPEKPAMPKKVEEKKGVENK